MRGIKIAGAIIVIIAIVCGIGVIGRVEFEDEQYKAGEIDSVTTNGELVKQIVIVLGVLAVGGAMWALGAYVEGERL